jgi:DNA polymerase III delta prime subunit
MMQSYREQLRLISQTIAQEKQLLKTQEHIRLLQELNRSNLPSLTDDAKVDLMKRIAEYEKQIVEIEAKLAELQSALQDIVI